MGIDHEVGHERRHAGQRHEQLQPGRFIRRSEHMEIRKTHRIATRIGEFPHLFLHVLVEPAVGKPAMEKIAGHAEGRPVKRIQVTLRQLVVDDRTRFRRQAQDRRRIGLHGVDAALARNPVGVLQRSQLRLRQPGALKDIRDHRGGFHLEDPRQFRPELGTNRALVIGEFEFDPHFVEMAPWRIRLHALVGKPVPIRFRHRAPESRVRIRCRRWLRKQPIRQRGRQLQPQCKKHQRTCQEKHRHGPTSDEHFVSHSKGHYRPHQVDRIPGRWLRRQPQPAAIIAHSSDPAPNLRCDPARLCKNFAPPT